MEPQGEKWGGVMRQTTMRHKETPRVCGHTLTHTLTHTRAHMHTHARTRTCTHMRTHKHTYLVLAVCGVKVCALILPTDITSSSGERGCFCCCEEDDDDDDVLSKGRGEPRACIRRAAVPAKQTPCQRTGRSAINSNDMSQHASAAMGSRGERDGGNAVDILLCMEAGVALNVQGTATRLPPSPYFVEKGCIQQQETTPS